MSGFDGSGLQGTAARVVLDACPSCQAGRVTVRLKRLIYRIAHPLLGIWWLTSRAQKRGTKCLLTNEGAMLLVRHTYGDRKRWDLPGGFVHRRETPLEAARREMSEELGVELAEPRPLGLIATRVWGRSDDVHYFAAELPGRELKLDPAELAESGWFDPEDLPERVGKHVREAVGIHLATR